jgi:methionyl-tRNA formyltransferase
MKQNTMRNQPRIGFGGDRQIAVRVLEHLIAQGCTPECLVLAGSESESHAGALEHRFREAGGKNVFRGQEVFEPRALVSLAEMELDFLILVHLQYRIPAELLSLPKHGVLNLHPAYLPENRGWHTPTWAILNETKFGATLHFMDTRIDQGDIVHQRELKIEPIDTADSLYQKALDLEFEVFREAWPSLSDGSYRRIQQCSGTGTAHKKKDLDASGVRELKLEESVPVGKLIRKLRALTTNKPEEACYFEEDGKVYWVQVKMGELRPAAEQERVRKGAG